MRKEQCGVYRFVREKGKGLHVGGVGGGEEARFHSNHQLTPDNASSNHQNLPQLSGVHVKCYNIIAEIFFTSLATLICITEMFHRICQCSEDIEPCPHSIKFMDRKKFANNRQEQNFS